jgi:tetratricopeptide (TPR) repeat protein
MIGSRGRGYHDPDEDSDGDPDPSRQMHDFYVDLGVQAERSDDPMAALEFYENAVRAEPDSPLAWYNYGDILLVLKRHEQAIAALQKAIELSPGNALLHYDLGLALYESGRHSEAAEEFARIVELDPKLKRASSNLMVSAMTNLALCQQAMGHPDQAVETLSPALRPAVDILYNLGRLHALARRPAKALPLATAAAALSPKSEDFVHYAGGILLDLKQYPEALGCLRQATRLNPRCAKAWHDCGECLARLKRRAEARKCFNRALREKPDFASSWYGLACLDALEGKREAAFRNLERAVEHGFKDAAHLRRDPDLRSLRRDGRWKTLLKTLGK